MKKQMDSFEEINRLVAEIIESEVRFGQSLKDVIANLLVPRTVLYAHNELRDLD